MNKKISYSLYAKISSVKGALSFLIKGSSVKANIQLSGPAPSFGGATYKISGQLESVSNSRIDALAKKLIKENNFSEDVFLKLGKNEVHFKNEDVEFSLSFILEADYNVKEFSASVNVFNKSATWILRSAVLSAEFLITSSVDAPTDTPAPSDPQEPSEPSDPTTPAPTPPSSTVGPFDPRLGIASMTYSWYTLMKGGKLGKELDAIASTCREAGIDLGKVAITIETHGINASPSSNTPDWKVYFKEHCDALPILYSEITRRGLGMVLYFWNSNTPGKGFKDSYKFGDSKNLPFIISCADAAMSKISDKSRLALSPCNEDDNSTEASVRNGLRSWFANKLPKNQLISYNSSASWARWNDFHPSSVKNLPSAPSNGFFTSDNGPIITDLYSSTWDSKTPNVGNHKTVMDKYGFKIPIMFYAIHLGAGFTPYLNEWKQIIKHAATKIGGSSVTNPPSDPSVTPDEIDITGHKSGYKGGVGHSIDKCKIVCSLTSVSVSGDMLTINKIDRSNKSTWPIEYDKKECNAILCIFWVESDGRVFGDKFEWLAVGSNGNGLRNVKGGILKDKSGVTHIPAKGTKCYLCITSTDFKVRSNTKSFIYP